MPEWKYTRRCTHTHLSGRRCAARIPKDKDKTVCLVHRSTVCPECEGMRAAFVPKRGW